MRFPLLPDVDGGLRELCFFHTGDSTTIEGDKSGRALGREVFGCSDGAVPSGPSLGGLAQRAEPGAQLEAEEKVAMP